MTATSNVELDQARVDAFAEKMLGVLNAGGLTLMLSIGHRTSLLDVLAEMPPATSAEIAEKAGLQERYVREWLGAMFTGGVIEYDPANRTYFLPREHAALLTRAAAPNNMAAPMQFFSVLGGVEDRIVDCFKNGGGVHYVHYNRFHEVMAEESAQTVVTALEEHILPLVPKLEDALRAGIDVLDVGCGSGRAMNLLASRFSNSRFAGFDFSEEAIARAQAEANSQGLTNTRFEVKDVSTIGQTDAYDLITAFDTIHDQAKPAHVLREIAAALRPTGTFLMQDIASSSHLHQNADHPLGSFLYSISCMHCMTVSLALGGAGLGTCWGEELACEMLKEAGFDNIKVQRLPHDIMNTYYVAKPA